MLNLDIARARSPQAIPGSKGPTIQLLRGGGGGGGGLADLKKKNILQVHMHKKKILAQDHRARKKCTYRGLEKKFWQDVP